MTDRIQLPVEDYRLLVAIRYSNAAGAICEGLRRQCGVNDFHFLVTLRSFIEYTRRGIWFLAWATEDELRAAGKLTFDRTGSPGVIKMDKMINHALGLGQVSHLLEPSQGIDEPFLNCLHALTHGNPISVRFLGFGLEKIFQTDRLLVRAEMERDLFTILICRRALGEDFNSIWGTLASINNRPADMMANAKIAAFQFKNSGLAKKFDEMESPTAF
jgi:hypothetical protein